jgi:hypothetical protein
LDALVWTDSDQDLHGLRLLGVQLGQPLVLLGNTTYW